MVLRDERARWVGRHQRATEEIERLNAERATVAAERDAAPPPPSLARTERQDGLPLWQVLDFASGIGDDLCAQVEAALQAAGVLDAWVRPGGRLLGANDLDVVLAADQPVPEGARTLAAYLVPDVPAGSGLSVDDVRRVLGVIGVGEEGDGPAWIGDDGRWRLGPANGRAHKQRAQFIGATARAQERARRLALLDAAIGEQELAAAAADRQRVTLDTNIGAWQQWVADVPSGQPLIRARSELVLRRDIETTEEAANRVAQESAYAARTATSQARSARDNLAAEHQLPTEAEGLDAVEHQLRDLAEQLRDVQRTIPALRTTISRWAEAVGELAESRTVLEADAAALRDAEHQAATSRASHESLLASIGDSVEQLQRRIAGLKQALAAAVAADQAAADRLKQLFHDEGEIDASCRHAQQRLEEYLHGRAGVLASLAAVTAVPGMLVAADAEGGDAGALAALGSHPATEPVGRAERATVDRLAGISRDEERAASTQLWRAYTDAESGPAGDHQPSWRSSVICWA